MPTDAKVDVFTTSYNEPGAGVHAGVKITVYSPVGRLNHSRDLTVGYRRAPADNKQWVDVWTSVMHCWWGLVRRWGCSALLTAKTINLQLMYTEVLCQRPSIVCVCAMLNKCALKGWCSWFETTLSSPLFTLIQDASCHKDRINGAWLARPPYSTVKVKRLMDRNIHCLAPAVRGGHSFYTLQQHIEH